MQVQQLRCFGARPGEGNPALVIQGDHSGEAARRAFAHEQNVTCVYLDAPTAPGVAATLDYYYPHMRSPLCLHATLAAAHVLFARHASGAALTLATALTGQQLMLTREGAELFVRLAAQNVAPFAVDRDLPARLLAWPGIALSAPPVVVSVGSPKLLLEVQDELTLHSLRPDLVQITAWGKANGVSGCYAYCRVGEALYEGRNFNHLDPRREDSATGVAAGALTKLLGHGIRLAQGRASGRSCMIRTGIDGQAILIGGYVESVQEQRALN